MAINLKPSDELMMTITAVAIPLAVFQNGTPNLADVRADTPGSKNSYKAANTAAITSAAILGVVALIGRSPTIFTIGGAVTLLEVWKHHYANFGAHGSADNNQTPGVA